MIENTTYYTAPDVARELRITKQRVYQIARRRGLGRKFGRDWVFTPAELEAMRVRGRPGRPRTKEL